MRPDNLLDRFEISPGAVALPPDAPPEPVLSSGPVLVEFDDPGTNDSAQFVLKQTAPPPAPGTNERQRLPLSPLRRGLSSASWVLAITVYFLTLLVLLPWEYEPPLTPPPIPVQLVLEQPPPPPPPPPPSPPSKPEPKPNMPNLASVDIGGPSGKRDQPQTKPEPETTQPEEKKSEEKQVAAAASAVPPTPAPPPPTPPPPTPPKSITLTSALPKPTMDAAPPLPEPDTEPPQTLDLSPSRPKQSVSARAPFNPRPTAHEAQFPGPAASRDEYLAYCAELISRYTSTIPGSLLSGRSGMTVLTLIVLDNGTISQVRIMRSSGYPDIDSKVREMVAAVHRFPPLPQWYQSGSMPLEYDFPFPQYH